MNLVFLLKKKHCFLRPNISAGSKFFPNRVSLFSEKEREGKYLRAVSLH
jgi:hypothetical protein